MTEAEQKELDDAYAVLACLMGTAIVAVVASTEGKNIYPELMRLVQQVPR